jgi:peptidoglycan/xylan/chitin deacetylase (PgdA/CDA1 family)
VVVTFDDGYADNLHNAKPLLERYGIPATVFLTTGYVGSEREFWWDELERLLLKPGTLPKVLHLRVNGSTYQWKLSEAARYSEDTSRRHQRWRAWKDAPPSSRQRLYLSLWQLLGTLGEGERQRVLDELREWAAVQPVGRPIHRPLSLEEVLALKQGQLIEVGAHTVTHPTLSALPPDAQRDEIQGSKAELERVLGDPVTSFAYPHGGRSDYAAETVDIVREAGFACACSNSAGIVGQPSDRFRLPRIHVQDWDREEFARRLSRWLWLSRWFHD